MLKGRYTIESSGCWLWTGSMSSSGYGKFKRNGKQVSAHRTSYEIAKGPIPRGLSVCHTCDVPRCVNPDHLFLGTHQDNMADMVAKGRAVSNKNGNYVAHRKGPSGERARTAKLTCAKVNEIRASQKPPAELASLYLVSARNIGLILTRKTWRHI